METESFESSNVSAGLNLKKYLPLALMAVAVIIFAGLLWWLNKGGDGLLGGEARGMEGDPLDVALGFIEPWLTARQSADTDPFTLGLHNSIILSTEMSARLADYEDKLATGELDPVLCQTTVPEGLRTLPVFKQEAEAKILVMSSDKTAGGQALVTLASHNGLWEITDITCGSAESDPNQSEFTFDKEGQLLKNVPAPLNSQYWHLVFEEGGVFGHTAPLFLDGGSMCNKDGVESVCSESMLQEIAHVHVQGSMTEAGVQVKRIEFR